MKSLLLGLCLSLIACTGFTKDAPKERDTFKFACEYVDFFYNVQCGDLPPPIVVKSKVVSNLYYGFTYDGEPYIFINFFLDDKKTKETIVHETTHYILSHRSKTKVSRCDSEEHARRAHNAWSGTEYNDKWRKQYNC